MTVYVVECGLHEDQYVGGVYASVGSAMAAHPIRPDASVRGGSVAGWHEETSLDGDSTYWANGCDWDDYASITAYEVEG